MAFISLHEVRGPDGVFVIRVDRRGVPTERFLVGNDVVQRLMRLVRRDKAWVLRVRRREDDPFGPDVYSEVVAAKQAVPHAMDDLVARVKTGEFGLGLRG